MSEKDQLCIVPVGKLENVQQVHGSPATCILTTLNYKLIFKNKLNRPELNLLLAHIYIYIQKEKIYIYYQARKIKSKNELKRQISKGGEYALTNIFCKIKLLKKYKYMYSRSEL